MNDRYFWIHIPTKKQGEELWSHEETSPYSEKEKLELLNTWNRGSMIHNEVPTYHYWM